MRQLRRWWILTIEAVQLRDLSKIADHMDSAALSRINENQVESVESFNSCYLLAFKWYDIHKPESTASRILVYLDTKSLFFICCDETACTFCTRALEKLQQEGSGDPQEFLCRFLSELFRDDMEYLDYVEEQVADGLTDLLNAKTNHIHAEIVFHRRELLRLKRYYEQMNLLFDEFGENCNEMLAPSTVRRLGVLSARMNRYVCKTDSLQEMISQMQDAYETQLSIQQNELMKFFTIITAIFLPLTLLVGWYGMNFTGMPELQWKFGYPLFIAVSLITILLLIWYFKRKKWL